MFAVLDAAEHDSTYKRQYSWQFDPELPLVELKVHGIVVVGMPVASLKEANKLLGENFPLPTRDMQGAPHDVVCARPFSAKPFVRAERPEPPP